MFLEFYGLREQPFGVTPNPRYLYHSPVHREALASLIYGIEADLGFAALIADPGMGKTTLLFYLLEKFRATARTALIFQTLCSPLEFLRYLASELEIQTNESDPVLLNERIKEVLVQEAQARRRVILIVDEAQNLDESVLETIRLLSDFETQNFKLLHIVLAGQLQLAEKLARPSMAQLLQRISMLNRLRPLTAEETRSYIEYRLNVAGYRGAPLFAKDAVELIAFNSGGVPRKINRICFNALSLGCALGKRSIDVHVVQEVGNDLDIGDLLFQKGAITDEVAAPQPAPTVEQPKRPPMAPPEVKKSSSLPPLESPARQWPSFPAAPSQPSAASVQRPPQAVAKPVAERPLPAPSKPASSPVAGSAARPAAPSAPPLAAPSSRPLVPGPRIATATPLRTPGYSDSRTSVQTTASVAPFAAANAPAPGIARPLSSTQPKPLPQPPPRPAQSTKPIVMPSREKQPAQQSRPFGIALATVLCGVIAFAGWTVWVKGPAHGSAAAVTAGSSAAPARSGQEIDLPTAADTSPNIRGAIERGKSAVRQKQEDKSSKQDVVKVSAPRREAVKPRGTGTTVVDFEQQPTPPSGEARAISAELIRKVPPIYPTEARRSGIQGSVTVAAVIGTDGRPKGVRALSGNPILARAATDAVSQWLYQPYYVNGRPVEVETEIVVDFALR